MSLPLKGSYCPQWSPTFKTYLHIRSKHIHLKDNAQAVNGKDGTNQLDMDISDN